MTALSMPLFRSAPERSAARPEAAPAPAGEGTGTLSVADYNACVAEHADGLYRFIRHRLRHEEDARDVVQNAFEALWRQRRAVDPARIKGWLYKVAYHDMIDGIRKRRREELVDHHDETLPGDPGTGYTGLADALRRALATLPDIQRSVVLLRDHEGYSYREIGEITGLGESQVKVYIHRARLRLREVLGGVDQYR
jgi:RNA polymerase sigma-70 factor (ECF subfamily)